MILAAHLVFLLIVILAWFSLNGLGLYYLLTPARLQRPGWGLILSPILGLAQMGLIGSWTFGLGFSCDHLCALQMTICGSTLLVALLRKRALMKTDLQAAGTFFLHHKLGLLGGIALYLFFLLPVFSAGSLGLIFRVGADVSQYPLQADFLLNHGTLSTATNPDLTVNPYADVMASNTRIVRWGTAFVLASLAQVTQLQPYEISFVVLIVILLLTGGAMAWFLRNMELPDEWTLWGALALMFNPNWLNLFFEHLEGQAYAMPLAIVLFAAALKWSADDRPKDTMRWIAFTSIIMAGLIVQHAETFLFFVPFLAAIRVVQSLWNRKESLLKSLLPLVVLVPALLLIGPSLKTLLLSFASLISSPHFAGWPQPRWAVLSEILGFSNIYTNFLSWLDGSTSVKILPREGLALLIPASLSLLLFVFCLKGTFSRSGSERAAYLLALVTVQVALIVMQAQGLQASNYDYFKIYTILLPLLLACLIVSVFSLKRKTCGLSKKVIAAFLGFAAVMNGCDYVVEYDQTFAHLTPADLKLAMLKGDPRYSHMAFLSLPYGGDLWRDRFVERLHDYALRVVMPGRILDQLINPHEPLDSLADVPVTLVVHRNSKFAPLIAKRHWPVLYENEDVLFYETGRKVKDVFTNQGPKLQEFYGPDVMAITAQPPMD